MAPRVPASRDETGPVISWRIRQFLFLLMAAFVAWVEGPANPFWVWNCVPIAASYLLLRRARQRNLPPLPEIAFFVVACGAVLVGHAALLEQWAGIAAASPAADRLFMVLPVYACALGGAAFGLAILFTSRRIQ